MSIIIKDLNFTYSPKTPFEHTALRDINLTIADGEWVCIVGHTGSGKSTFVQHLNALIKLQSGSIVIDGIDLTDKKVDLKKLRSTVGMVFQYPEYQLFADTVYNDVAFGLKNMKVDAKEVEEKVKLAIQLVGLDFEYIKNKSPFELSGGEKRRVAIAGVIVLQPKILVLDEPTAGLDPRGKKEILQLIARLKQTVSPTIVMISHDMDEVASWGSRVVVFNDATIMYDMPVDKLFVSDNRLEEVGLVNPQLATLYKTLKKHNIDIGEDCLSVDKMRDAIVKYAKGAKDV